ncbi:hypothetical protein CERSUDRAFT_86285 [Gelatoporia subvermispora B]|uniref:DUF6533 domain-containing protein n=1 Tax=Ceriporiopsis subvermispora (strain B) TaxID=914234 RepID=M2R820_CERS8|nr:hypothetical protein CERSUDRAFT_86285 [Gelatoporia subvermispora B]
MQLLVDDFDLTSVRGAAVQLDTNRYLAVFSFVILYYDYCLTFPMEVDRFWLSRRKISWGSSFFFLVRYLSIFGHVPVIFQVFWPSYSPKPCLNLQMYHQLFSVILQVLVGVLLIMRTYALYQRSRKILWLLIAVASGVIAVGCWATLAKHPDSPIIPLDVGCTTSLSTIHIFADFTAAWSGMLVFDLVVFLLTLVKCIKLGRGNARTLLDIFVRDGECMAGANLSNILTFIVSPLIKGVTTIFTNIVSATLISRLMLNLRDPKILLRQDTMTFGTSTAPSTPFVSTLEFIPPRFNPGQWINGFSGDLESQNTSGLTTERNDEISLVLR